MTAKRTLLDGSPNPKYRDGDSGKSGKGGIPLTAFKKGDFCAWDGEGCLVNGKHEYILLANSAGHCVQNLDGISTTSCLNFICSEARKMDRRTIHVWFVMSYDVNMMLRDCPKSTIAAIWAGGRVDFGDFNIYYRNRKEFVVRRFNPQDKWQKNKEGQWERKWIQTVRMWDVFGFFQTRFIDALKEWVPEQFHGSELEVIEQNKNRRAEFTTDEIETIKAYCFLELHGLNALCERLRDYLATANLVLRRWDGAGSVAASLLRKQSVRKHMSEQPPSIQQYSRHAYAGGRIELLRYGWHEGGIYTYDINSAYPSAMRDLPDLSNGHWQATREFQPDSYGLWHVKYHGDKYARIHPLFYRDKTGRIFYPYRTEGIFWTPEVVNALAFHADKTELIQGWVWCPDSDAKPFAFIDDLYTLRQQWKAQKIGAQMVLKLGLNSLYGKMAQQIGGHDGQKPPYHQLEWAGFITSVTRARVYRAAIQAPESIIFMATDGISSTTPLTLPIGSRLGDWESGYQYAILAVQSGIYFYFKESDSNPKSYYRGFDKGVLSPDRIRDAYLQYRSILHCPSTRFITMGGALAGADSWERWRTWHTIERKLSLSPVGTKRYPAFGYEAYTEKRNPATMLFPTIATPFYLGAKGGMSHPYPIRWLGEDWTEQYLEGLRMSEYEAECEDSYQ